MTNINKLTNEFLDNITKEMLKYFGKKDIVSLREVGIGLMFGGIMSSIGVDSEKNEKKKCLKKRFLILYSVIFSLFVYYYESHDWYKRKVPMYNKFVLKNGKQEEISYIFKIFLGSILGGNILPSYISMILGFIIEIIVAKITGYSIIIENLKLMFN